jgi:hypothetical protein
MFSSFSAARESGDQTDFVTGPQTHGPVGPPHDLIIDDEDEAFGDLLGGPQSALGE